MASAEPPEQRAGILYVDTSALLKLLVREAESTAIEHELARWPSLATSIVTEVELPRAVARVRQDRPDAVIDGSLILGRGVPVQRHLFAAHAGASQIGDARLRCVCSGGGTLACW
jgi:uncharacterized protein with PIN domain